MSSCREEKQHKANERALTLQEREMHRYYQPWLNAQGTSINVAAHVQDLAEVDDFTQSTLSDQGFRALASRDKALTAFAQLAALRLNVRRCMVSLIDSKHQYILAEATRTLSLVDDSRHAENDELWLGNAVVARDDAICQCAFERQYTVKDDTGKVIRATAAVMADCRLDDDYKDKPYVVQEPGVRFYAGVPIRSRSGHNIGVYAVSHDSPRDALTYDELRFMQDIAVAIMDHLEWARDRVDRYKGERIVRGMADFIEASPSMRAIKREMDVDDAETATTPRPAEAKDAHRRPQPQRVDSLSSARPSTLPRSESFTKPSESQPSGLTRLLDRAARILRESTLAEGAVFFGPTGNSPAKSTLRSAMAARDRMSGTDDESTKYAAANLHPDMHDAENSTDSDSHYQMRTSRILGLSLTNKKDYSLFHNTALDVTTLESYFKLYPSGKSLHFSEAGSGLSSEDDSASESQRSATDTTKPSTETASQKVIGRKRKIRMSHQELLKNLPGVKNVIFLPLWDYVEEKMVAGCFLWTSSTGRMMNLDDDLSYLRAFGNTIMSEVARMNALKDDRAKTTFIASMSHELRSPLHGILGSVEFLQDTHADAYQASLINSVATCGKTLLDTLDHVLDYAKINKLGRTRMRKNAKSNRLATATGSTLESLNIPAEVDLGLIVEEVVEAVCAGHAFKKMHTGELKAGDGGPLITLSRHSTSTADGDCTQSSAAGEVAVLLDISPRANWKVRTQPGALRRIIMNLLGNALKYTSQGFVAVSLRAQESTRPHKIDVVFKVVDSGKGMSEEYQKSSLFVPFSQEDTFQPGTGLGLSIVRQIVDSLGGTIDIKSVQDVGTEVDVRLSLSPADSDAIDMVDEEIAAVAAKTRGLRLCLLDAHVDKRRKGTDHHIKRLDTALAEVCWGWFEMEVTKADNLKDADADLFLYTEPPSVEYLLEHHGVDSRQNTDGGRGKEVPLIIICLNTSEAIAITANHIKQLSDLGRIVEVIPQPCGPRKLAQVLKHCITRTEEALNRPLKPERQPQPVPHRSRLEDMGAASVLGLPSMTLPRLNSSEEKRESVQTRGYIRNVCSQVPPSPAVTFPNVDCSVGSTRTESAATMTARKPHVLLVDDNKINLQLLVMFMKKHHFPYQQAMNGQEALEKYIEFSSYRSGNWSKEEEEKEDDNSDPCKVKRAFDFVLMDISMPIMDGFEATRRIREFEADEDKNYNHNENCGNNNNSNNNNNGRKRKKTTIIALTGLASAEAQADAADSGIDIYMPKPVKFQTLRPLLVCGEREEKKEEKKEEKEEKKEERKEIEQSNG
jgi:signal transduction histidine kinase/CheY-like chemotaxis protein